MSEVVSTNQINIGVSLNFLKLNAKFWLKLPRNCSYCVRESYHRVLPLLSALGLLTEIKYDNCATGFISFPMKELKAIIKDTFILS